MCLPSHSNSTHIFTKILKQCNLLTYKALNMNIQQSTTSKVLAFQKFDIYKIGQLHSKMVTGSHLMFYWPFSWRISVASPHIHHSLYPFVLHPHFLNLINDKFVTSKSSYLKFIAGKSIVFNKQMHQRL